MAFHDFCRQERGRAASLLAGIRNELTAWIKMCRWWKSGRRPRLFPKCYSLERTFAALSSAFGFLALLLACEELYGTMAYAVARKTNEIGIRMALGAERGTILAMVCVRQPQFSGWNRCGSAGCLDRQQSAQDPVFGLTPHDPWSIGCRSWQLCW